MSITGLAGPLAVFGANTFANNNPEEGPSLFWGGAGIMDQRQSLTYTPGQNFGNPVTGWLGFNKILTMNCIPAALSATLVAATQTVSGAVPMALASANATGVAVGVNGPLFNGLTTSVLTNALCLDPLVASVTATVVSGTNLMTVTAVGAPGGVCYNQLALGMVMTNASLPVGTFITAFGTGIGGLGTYLLSKNATAAITAGTVTGVFVGVFTSLGLGVSPLGVLPSIPFGSSGTIQLYNPAATCSRVLVITPNTTSTATVTFTIVGADVYGQSMTEQITIANASAAAVNGLKAWKFIKTISASGSGGAITYSVGTTATVGFPLRSDNFTAVAGVEYDISLYFNSAVVVVTTGYTPANALPPATAITGDVRGTYTLQTVPNGTLRLIATQSPNPAAMGVGTLGVGLFGIPHYSTL